MSKRNHEGLLIIDHSDSPGITPEDANGIGPVVGKGQVGKFPTFCCSHCQVTVIMNPLRTRPRNHCFKCDSYICDNPGCHRECVPFEKRADEVMNRAAKGLEVDLWLP